MAPNHPNRSQGRTAPPGNPTPEEIRNARELAGLTQDAAGKLVFSGWRSWQNWEGGERKMHPAFWALFLMRTGQIMMDDLEGGKR